MAIICLLDKNRVDVTFNFRLLQHFKTSAERIALLSELARVSRQTIIVSVYLKSGFHRLTQKISGRKRRMTLISRAQWESELQACGLSVVKMRRHCVFARPMYFLVGKATALSV